MGSSGGGLCVSVSHLLPCFLTPGPRPPGPFCLHRLPLSWKPRDKRPFYTEARLSSPDAQGVATSGAAPGAGGGREEGLPRPQEGARLLTHLDSRTSGVAPPPGLGHGALTWQIDVGRCAGLAAATGLGAAVLQDVLDGRHAALCRGWGRLGGLQAGCGPAIPQGPDSTPTPPCSPGTQKQVVYYAFFLFPFLLPSPHTAWNSVLFLSEKHPMPTLKRPSAIFQDGQGGTQLQAHNRAFMWGVDPPPYTSDLSWDLPCACGALRGAWIPQQGPGGPWFRRGVQAGRSCHHPGVKLRPERQRGLSKRWAGSDSTGLPRRHGGHAGEGLAELCTHPGHRPHQARVPEALGGPRPGRTGRAPGQERGAPTTAEPSRQKRKNSCCH